MLIAHAANRETERSSIVHMPCGVCLHGDSHHINGLIEYSELRIRTMIMYGIHYCVKWALKI